MSYRYSSTRLESDPKVSQEEVRRARIAENACSRLDFLIQDLRGLQEKDLRQTDPLRALITTGTKIMELGLHTKGRLRALEGRSDAFLEATAANVLSGLRQAERVMEEHDLDLGAWAEAQEILKPVFDDLKAISGRLERPGVKSAVTPPEKSKPEPGPRLLQEDGEPAPGVEIPREPLSFPSTLACGPVIDAEILEPEDSLEEFEAWDETERRTVLEGLLSQLEEDGVAEGRKRRDWKKAQEAWQTAAHANPKDAFRRLIFAVHHRNEISWSLPTDEEIEAFEEGRQIVNFQPRQGRPQ